ncbi:MAG: hypothetical protein LBT10_09290 [Methanobrevibacter sp.]|nr:hypothetical protein [Methanobrevibacter sp.]
MFEISPLVFAPITIFLFLLFDWLVWAKATIFSGESFSLTVSTKLMAVT